MQQVIKRIRLLAIYLVLLLPVIVYGAVHALQSSNNSPIDWVDPSFPERGHYDDFVEMFGPGDVVIASWPECVWSDERLDKLVRGLRESKTFRDSDGNPLFHQVMCGREMLMRMVKPSEQTFVPPANSEATESMEIFDPQEITAFPDQPRMSLTMAVQRLQGTMIGGDGRTTCVVATLNRTGLAVRASVVDNLRRAIRVCCDVADEDIHLAGPVIDGLTTDQASHRSLTNFAAPSSIVIFVICWWSLGSLLHGVVVFCAASFCQCALLAVIYYTGEKLSALLIILAPLVQVLTVSGGIHLMNYYKNSLLFGMMIVGAAGLPRLETSIRIETLFASDSRVMQDYRWLEDHLGPLVPIEILVTFEDISRLNDRRQVDIVWRISKTLQRQPHVRATTSALTFFPSVKCHVPDQHGRHSNGTTSGSTPRNQPTTPSRLPVGQTSTPGSLASRRVCHSESDDRSSPATADNPSPIRRLLVERRTVVFVRLTQQSIPKCRA